MSATITFSRVSPKDVQQRPVFITVDGQAIGQLMYGETLSHAVEPGAHDIHVQNTFHWKTLKLKVSEDEQVRVGVLNRAGRFTWFLLFFLGAGPLYVSLQREN